MLTTILISFAAFAFGFFLAGFMAGTKDSNKSPIERFREADDDIDIRNLSDDDLEDYCAICHNGKLNSDREMRNRGL